MSPETAYALLRRYETEGAAAWSDRSRRPEHSPRQTSAEMEERVLALRDADPNWGGRKL
ncbi:MAG TPA: helix-turn-helix domain-containing protein, partial [Longimicrobiaceae bacterium]|nr:helix-turn-helix domain-containing protein [Longimicrobiaceae bacterium]